MPWRESSDPYRIWVSEIMLQQTQVDTVIPYFERFIAQFPTIEALAKTSQQAVLKAWEGLGYYARARNLHRAAQVLFARGDRSLPTGYEELKRLPGLGDYTAAAVASIAFGEAVPVVDGNVLRVIARFRGLEDDIALPKTRRDIFAWLEPVIAREPPSLFNQAMMELGALVCRPRNPSCHACPLRLRCVAYRDEKTHVLPVKGKRAPVPHYDIAVGVIWKKGRILIARRKESAMLGGLWEFPGGKRQSAETWPQALVREVREETGLQVGVGLPYCTVDHAYTHFKITLKAFYCDYISGRLSAKESEEVKWVTLDELDQHPFPSANKQVIAAIRAHQTSGECLSPSP